MEHRDKEDRSQEARRNDAESWSVCAGGRSARCSRTSVRAACERAKRLRKCACAYLYAHARTSVLNYAACIFSGLFGGSQSLAGNPASLRAHRVTRLQEARKTRENFSISQQAAPARDLAERRGRQRPREGRPEKARDGWQTKIEGGKPPSSRENSKPEMTLGFLAGKISASLCI